MQRVRAALGVSLCIGSLLIGLGCAPTASSSTESTLPGRDAALAGTWQGTGTGSGLNWSITVEFRTDGTFTISGNSGFQSFTNYGTYSTDESQTPKWINVYNQHGQNWYGLYEISGTTLRWSESTAARPTSVSSGSGVYVLNKVQ